MFHPTAGGLKLCPGQSEPLSAALNEQEGRPDQTLACATEMGILPLPDARYEYHHVPHLLQGTMFITCNLVQTIFSPLMLIRFFVHLSVPMCVFFP